MSGFSLPAPAFAVSTPIGLRDAEALQAFGDVNELVRISPGGEIIRFGAPKGIDSALLSKVTGAVSGAAKQTVAAAAPVGAQYTTIKAAPKAVSVSAQASAPKLAVMAPPATKPTAAAVKVATPAPTVTRPTAAAPAVVKAPAAVVKAPTPAPAGTAPKVATTALTGNFLEPGGAPLAAPNVQAATPRISDAQLSALKRAELELEQQRLAAINAAYARDRQANDTLAMQSLYDLRKDPWEHAGLDVAQIVMGSKVLAVGASIIASGGAAAGAVGLTGAGASLATAAAADRLVAAVEKGGELGKTAKSVIDDAKAAAKKGEAAAKTAVAAIETATKERVAKAFPKGAERALSDTAKLAFDTVAGAVQSGLAERVLANLRSAGASVAAVSVSNAGYNQVPTPTVRREVVAPVNQGRLDALASIDLGQARPRWLVTDLGAVTSIDRVPTAAGGRGFIVWSTGEVVRQ